MNCDSPFTMFGHPVWILNGKLTELLAFGKGYLDNPAPCIGERIHGVVKVIGSEASHPVLES